MNKLKNVKFKEKIMEGSGRYTTHQIVQSIQ